MTAMISWIKGLGLSVKDCLYTALFLVFSGLLVALKLKDSELHAMQVQQLQDKFKCEDDKANAAVKAAKEKYNEDA